MTLAGWPKSPLRRDPADLAENARAKALYYAAHTGELTVAEDSGPGSTRVDGRRSPESARFEAESTYPRNSGLSTMDLR